MRPLLLGIAVAVGILGSTAAGQCPLDPWGYAVGALDGGRAAVSRGTSQGPCLYLLAKSASGWQVEHNFVLGDLMLIYPSPVALDGDRALAGAPESSEQRGRAYVFDRVGTQWVQTELFSPNVQFGDFFGSVAALDGDVAVVGADHWPVGGGDGIGRVHVFELQGSVWTEVALLGIHPTAADVEGTTMAVGSDKLFPGRVEIYERIGGSWVLTQTIPGTTTLGPALGSALALQGDTLVVGSRYGSARPGYVNVYRRQGGTWQQVQHLVASDSAARDSFGSSLALSGSTLLVGAPWNAGRVYRFEHDGTAFVETAILDPEPGIGAFGWNVAVEGEDGFLGGSPYSHFYRLGFAEVSSFCPATPNSTGASGVLSAEGCDSRSGERLSLVSNRLPPTAVGAVFFGINTTQQPFGDGTLCIGSPIRRLPVSAADPSGRMVHEVDFGTWPGSLLAAGRTWKFQTVFRDPAGAGAGFNLTNALAIPITP